MIVRIKETGDFVVCTSYPWKINLERMKKNKYPFLTSYKRYLKEHTNISIMKQHKIRIKKEYDKRCNAVSVFKEKRRTKTVLIRRKKPTYYTRQRPDHGVIVEDRDEFA